MKNQITRFIGLALLFIALLCPLFVYAATPLEPTADASLTLHYQKEGQTFSDLPISIYRVAEAFPDGTFELIEPYASYPVDIHNITQQEQWTHTAVTLCSYIVANQIDPDSVEKTDEKGSAVFRSLETGLYLVREVIAENNSGTYIFNQFMVYLPTPQSDGSFQYDVEAKPKCLSYVPKNQYTVTKLWQDSDNREDRPEQVTVDIYKDGVLQDTQILNASNNWSYIWYVTENDQSVWTVSERSVADNYTVTIQQNGGSFSIINTHKPTDDTPDIPQTGDTSDLMLYLMLMCISGILLIIIGIFGRRKRSV